MKKILFVAALLLVMAGFNCGNVFAQGIGGGIAALLMEAGGGGRTAGLEGNVTGTWSTPYSNGELATDGDFSTFASGSTSHDNSGENKQTRIVWDMGEIFNISLITAKVDITGTVNGRLFIEVSQDGVVWIQLQGTEIGIHSSPLQKEYTVLSPYRIRYISFVNQTAYTVPSNIRIYELVVQ